MRLPKLSAVLVLVAFSLACGGGSNQTPATPATPPPTTITPVTLATPEPPPGALSCGRIGNGVATGERCRVEAPTFLEEVGLAIDQVANEKPQIFDGERVLSTGQFYVGVIQNLDQKGICAGFDGEELQVKTSNDFNDQYHLVTSSFIVRRGRSSYMATCYPAAFPSPLPPYIPAGSCSLAPSREITCGRESSGYLDLVHASVEDVARAHPEVLDVRDQRGENGYRILDGAKFVQYTLEAIRSRGFCARHDGEEFVVKKENTFSEHFDLELSEGYVRRGEGSYESTCYPAAF